MLLATPRYPFGFSLGWQPVRKIHIVINQLFKIFLKQQHRFTPLLRAADP
jgi:hypothetical protein